MTTTTDAQPTIADLRAKLAKVRADRDAQERAVAQLDEDVAHASADAYLAGTQAPSTADLDAAKVRLRGLEVAERLVSDQLAAAERADKKARESVLWDRHSAIAQQRTGEIRTAFALMHLAVRTLSRWSPHNDPALRELPYVAGRHVVFASGDNALLAEANNLRSQHSGDLPQLVGPFADPSIANLSNVAPSPAVLDQLADALRAAGVTI